MQNWLIALLLAGLLGAVGQGVRSVVGLKKAADDAAAAGKNLAEVFSGTRLAISLIIGFIAGVLAGILTLDPAQTPAPHLLLTLVAAGYAGTDAIEAMLSKAMPAVVATPAVRPVGSGGL